MSRLSFTRGYTGMVVVMALGLMGGCAAEPPAATDDMSDPVGVTIPEMPVPPAVTINHVMVAQIDHASHALWDAARSDNTPETDEDWLELEHHAIQVASAGTIIALGGTGQADPGYVRLVGWSSYAQDMTNAAVSAMRASQNQDLDGLISAGDELVLTCEACHEEFKPDLPSEGYLHPHYFRPE